MTISQKEIEQAAGLIQTAYETHQPIAPLRESFDMTIEDAYAVQRKPQSTGLNPGGFCQAAKLV